MHLQQPRHKVQHQASLSEIVFFAFCFDCPFHATRLAALVSSRSFARDLAPVSILLYRAFNLLVLPICHFSFPLVGTVQSFVLLYHPTISPVTRFLSTHRPFVSKLYLNTLIDKNILAFSDPNHGFDRGEYMHDMVFYLHRRFLVFLVSQLSC